MKRDAGLMILRLGTGAVAVAHGTQKLFGWFGGQGLVGSAVAFEELGFRPGRPHVLAAGLCETVGGSLLAAGLASRVAGVALAGNMTVAASTRLSNGFAAPNGGVDFPALLVVAASSLALSGGGRLSVDQVIGHRLEQPWMMRIALIATVPSAMAIIARRRRALASSVPPMNGPGSTCAAPSNAS